MLLYKTNFSTRQLLNNKKTFLSVRHLFRIVMSRLITQSPILGLGVFIDGINLSKLLLFIITTQELK